MESISRSGMFKNDEMKVEVTLMDAEDYCPPLEGCLAFDVRIQSKMIINAKEVEYSLLCNGEMYTHNEVLDTLPTMFPFTTGTHSYFQCVTVVFQTIKEVHYNETQFLMYFPSTKQLVSIPLKY